jgi:hypothetical protein
MFLSHKKNANRPKNANLDELHDHSASSLNLMTSDRAAAATLTGCYDDATQNMAPQRGWCAHCWCQRHIISEENNIMMISAL